MIKTTIDDRPLRLQIGNHQDMFYAVQTAGRGRTLIQQVFLNIRRCEEHIKMYNYNLRRR